MGRAQNCEYKVRGWTIFHDWGRGAAPRYLGGLPQVLTQQQDEARGAGEAAGWPSAPLETGSQTARP